MPEPDKTGAPMPVGLRAMSLDVPDTPGHPNKRPFRGILTRLDEPSDAPPHGTGDRRSVLTTAAAKDALATLLGMAVDFTADLTGHDVAQKIGVITEATIEGNAIVIGGHFFAQDFPAEMRRIDANKAALGFSFELTPTAFTITADNHYRVDACVFTGAALLFRDKAAYHSTSLAAATQPSSKGKPMDTQDPGNTRLDEIAAAVATLTTTVAGLATQLAASTAAAGGVSASHECMAAVEPHAKALESCAASMKAAGIGAHPDQGHVAVLHRMAGRMRAEAAMGKMPHIWRDHDWPMSAAATPPAASGGSDPELAKQLKTITDSLAALTTQIGDVRASVRAGAPAPDRRTASPELLASLMRRNGVTGLDLSGEKLPTDEEIAKALRAAGVTPEQSMLIKRTVERVRSGLPV
jgi:hypothetical protein